MLTYRLLKEGPIQCTFSDAGRGFGSYERTISDRTVGILSLRCAKRCSARTSVFGHDAAWEWKEMASPSSSNGRSSLTPRRVVVTGVGAVTSLAPTATETWERILAGESGLKRVDLDPEQNPCLVRGDVDDATITNRFLDGKALRNTSRFPAWRSKRPVRR